MATIKAYSDLEQSKKLAEILPIESADMLWEQHGAEPYVTIKPWTTRGKSIGCHCLSCWSLAALLSVIPKHIKDYNVLRIDISENDTSIWYDEVGSGVNNDLPDITMESAVDACYEMIIRLSELKVL